MDYQKLFSEAWRQCPAIAILGAVIVTGAFQYWVFGSAYRDMKEDRDRFRAIAFESVGIIEKHAVAPTPSPTPIATDAPRERGEWHRRHRDRDQIADSAPAKSTPAASPVPVAEVANIRAKLSKVQALSPKE